MMDSKWCTGWGKKQKHKNLSGDRFWTSTSLTDKGITSGEVRIIWRKEIRISMLDMLSSRCLLDIHTDTSSGQSEVEEARSRLEK